MKIFIFQRGLDPKSRHAGVIQAEIEAETGKAMEHSFLKRAGKKYLYKKANKNAPELPDHARPTVFYIDPILGFTENDIPDHRSFGNGCSSGSLKLTDGRTVECYWMVVDRANEAAFNGKIARIKAICNI